MIKKLGIPYMGSKRSLAPKILDFILQENPNCKYIYDLFGGGGAISFEAIQRPQIEKVFYNELNTGVTELLKKIQSDGVTDDFYEWISREDFMKYKGGDCWKSGLAKTCWSFGSNQSSYLFGKDIEDDKRLLHEIIVNKCSKSVSEFEKKFGMEIHNEFLVGDTINARRLSVLRLIKSLSKERNGLEQLQGIQHLERIQRLEQLKHLHISNKSYKAVEISTPVGDTVVYLDPPYADTATYQCRISHEDLYEYIEKSPYKIYLSSYESHLPCVLEIEHRSKLSQTKNKKTIEKLFTNKK